MTRAFFRPVFLMLLVTGCSEPPPQALGTLEYDRITLPAPAAERILAIEVREGERVEAGARLLTLDRTGTQAQTEAALAEAQRRRDVLAELRAGARSEQIAQARANLAAARADARDANAYYDRVRELAGRKLVSAADVDRARAAASSGSAEMRRAEAALDELEHGTRQEQIAQAKFIIVFPDSTCDANACSSGNFNTNHRGLNNDGPKYMDSLFELMAHVEANFRTAVPVEVEGAE